MRGSRGEGGWEWQRWYAIVARFPWKETHDTEARLDGKGLFLLERICGPISFISGWKICVISPNSVFCIFEKTQYPNFTSVCGLALDPLV